MKHFEFNYINKKINKDVISNALKNDFHIILGGRSNGKKAFLEALGFKIITYSEYLKLKKRLKNEN